MKPNWTKVQAFPGRRRGRAREWLLVIVAISSLLSCATPETASEAVTPTGAIPLTVTKPPGAEIVGSKPGPEASAIPETATSLMATSTPAATTQLITKPAPFTAVPLSTTAPVDGTSEEGTLVYTYRIVNIYPHDREAFTQGLVLEDGAFYEGTGLWGSSTLRRVELESGDVLQLHPLAPEYFGEGITIFGHRIIQLTWKAQLGFVYDKDSFELLATFRYPTEGWGITHDGTRLIMSDGSSTLYFLDPETFEEIGQIQVFDDRGPVSRLNELEYVQEKIYANVWQTDRVAIIEPETGQVTAWIDLQGLLDAEDLLQPVDVLNGIAYDAAGERLFVTGKWWPKLFEVELLMPQ